ncbi:MAG: type VI secretion system baseplate subunit TssE [Pirellulales bacterium]|nr:type VI secretion system baseplate subunit TssE [Pirellulales bacterium]
MTRIPIDQPLTPSVLDRLLDDDPTTTRETVKMRTQVLREMKQSLRRDLENLLNTRRRAKALPDDWEELSVSLVNYGIPDITGADLGAAESRADFAAAMEQVLRDFEPRFKSVHVEMLGNPDPTQRTLRFRIEGLLHAEPAPEPIAFDSALEPATGNVEIKGSSR